MKERRRTKIVATFGPALSKATDLEKAILAGIDVIRINFSHGKAEDHLRSIRFIREITQKLQCEVAICADLQGPKIRIACFKNKKIHLDIGNTFTIDMALAPDAGDEATVGCDYPALVHDVAQGDTLVLNDGRIILVVEKIVKSKIVCTVKVGGELSDHKGVNRLGGGLSAPAFTEKDKKDLEKVLTEKIDYVAISFPRSAKDIMEVKKRIEKQKMDVGVIAKIERAEAIDNIDEIIEVSDAVMVARGDLGVEIGEAEVPAMQKMIIQRARALNRTVITATQMMESMIYNTIPTRAEVSDVANAVLDGTDAVMLSAETAVGDYPIRTIETMSRICLSAEKNPLTTRSRHRVECQFTRPDEAIAMAAMYTANHLAVEAIASLTESGTTPLLMSRIRSGMPIYALTRHINTARKVKLYRGVYPILFDVTEIPAKQIDHAIAKVLEQKNVLKKGETILITKGDTVGVHGCTNVMKIYCLN